MTPCTHPDIVVMDHWRDDNGRKRWVNRCCRACWTHWSGPEAGEVKEYTKAEWDAYLSRDITA